METRICRYCEKKHPIDFYELANIIKGKEYRRWKCKYCYLATKQKRKQNIRTWFNSLKKELKCKKCGEDRWYVFDFHHKNPEEKEMNMGNCVGRGWSKERIIKEVAKCEVLCANCHRELHWLEK